MNVCSPTESALQELTAVHVNKSLPVNLRLQQFLDEVSDPYSFTVNGTTVKITFTGDGSIDDRLSAALVAMNSEGQKTDDHFRLSDPMSDTVA